MKKVSLPMLRATASSSYLLSQCQHSFRQEAEWSEFPASEEQTRGNQVHAFAEAYVNDAGSAMPQDPMQRAVADWIDAQKIRIFQTEIPLAWDPATDTARELVKGKHREYLNRQPNEFCGTADLCWMDGDHTAIVVDFKTGNDITTAFEQMRSLSLMVARAWKVDRVQPIILKIGEEGCEEIRMDPLHDFDLALIAMDLRSRLESIHTSEPVPGMWCTSAYCNHRIHCTVTQSAMAQSTPDDPQSHAGYAYSTEIVNVQHAQWLLYRINLIKKAEESIRYALKEWVRKNGEIPTTESKVWGPTQVKDSSFNKAGAIALLEQHGVSRETIDALTQKSSHERFVEHKRR